jgi:hypothetical protein
MSIELAALLVGIANGVILLLKPIARLHSRLDLIEYRLVEIERLLDGMESEGYDTVA